MDMTDFNMILIHLIKQFRSPQKKKIIFDYSTNLCVLAIAHVYTAHAHIHAQYTLYSFDHLNYMLKWTRWVFLARFPHNYVRKRYLAFLALQTNRCISSKAGPTCQQKHNSKIWCANGFEQGIEYLHTICNVANQLLVCGKKSVGRMYTIQSMNTSIMCSALSKAAAYTSSVSKFPNECVREFQ